MHSAGTGSLKARSASEAATKPHHGAGDLIAKRCAAVLVVNWLASAIAKGNGEPRASARSSACGGGVVMMMAASHFG